MSAALGVGLIVIGVALIPVAAVLIVLGSRSLARVLGLTGMEFFTEYVRLIAPGTVDSTRRSAARQTRAGWALWLGGMLLILVGALLVGST